MTAGLFPPSLLPPARNYAAHRLQLLNVAINKGWPEAFIMISKEQTNIWAAVCSAGAEAEGGGYSQNFN
jgi:hypothetical protein